MTDPPRIAPPSQAERQATLAKHYLAGAGVGGSRYARALRAGGSATVLGGDFFALVFHGADNTVPRPAAQLVFWIGSAVPDEIALWDLRYNGTEFD